jgi:hypothetical protein
VAADARAVSCDTALCDGSQVRGVLQAALCTQYVSKQRCLLLAMDVS